MSLTLWEFTETWLLPLEFAGGTVNQFAMGEAELTTVWVTAYDLMPHKVMPSLFPYVQEA